MIGIPEGDNNNNDFNLEEVNFNSLSNIVYVLEHLFTYSFIGIEPVRGA